MSASAQAIMRDYAAFKWPSLNHKGRIASLARALGFGHRRTRSIYQNEPGVALRADELAAIETLRSKRADDAVGTSRENYRLLEARLARLEALFESVDPEFGGEFMAAYRAQLRGQGGSPGASGAGNGRADHFDADDE